MCPECYSEQTRATPILKPLDCLKNHAQYICGTCGRCICIERSAENGLFRWNFPFRSAEIAKLYLRAADYTTKKSCGIYEIKSSKGRISYKIFPTAEDLTRFLRKSKDKTCPAMAPVFTVGEYREYENTQVRRLTAGEVQKYMSERQ